MRQTDKDPESQPQSVQQKPGTQRLGHPATGMPAESRPCSYPVTYPMLLPGAGCPTAGRCLGPHLEADHQALINQLGFPAAQPQPRAPHLHRGLHGGHGLVQGRERGHGRHQHLVANQDVPLHQGLNQRRWGNGDVRGNLLEEKETERCTAGQQRDRIINAEK